MTQYIILRATGSGYQPRGPVAQPLELKQARKELAALKSQHPHVRHILFKEHAEAHTSTRIVLRLIDPPQRCVRRASDDGKVVLMTKKQEVQNG